MKPKRIQRKRTAGWRMPENAVYVGRPSVYGNPYTVTKDKASGRYVVLFGDALFAHRHDKRAAQEKAVELYERFVLPLLDCRPLAGKDLACWCGFDEVCHADVLLKAALNSGKDRKMDDKKQKRKETYFVVKGISMDRYDWFVGERGEDRAIAMCRDKKSADMVCAALNEMEWTVKDQKADE